MKTIKWIISLPDYGSFEFFGTEQEAEEMRRHKATWEGERATKQMVGEIDIPEQKDEN